MQPAAQRQALKRLVEIYAIRSRELSEALSVLGGHLAAQRPIDNTLMEIRRINILVEEAHLALLGLIEEPLGRKTRPEDWASK